MAFGFIWSLAKSLFGYERVRTAATALGIWAATGAVAPTAIWVYSALYAGPGGVLTLAAFVMFEIVVAVGVVRPRAQHIAKAATKVLVSRGVSLMGACWLRRLSLVR